MKYNFPLGYVSKYDKQETIEIIDYIYFEIILNFKKSLDLKFTMSQIVCDNMTWLNDDFDGTERPIDFDIPDMKIFGEIIQSSNKWRRKLISDTETKGIINFSDLVRRDIKINNYTAIVKKEIGIEILDNEEINIKENLSKIYSVIYKVFENLRAKYPKISKEVLNEKVNFISYKELKNKYPLNSFEERLNLYGREVGVFILTDYIKSLLNTNKKEYSLSEDVFDFSSYISLFVYDWLLEKCIELGYSAYQVDKEVLLEQNKILKENWKNEKMYNSLLKENLIKKTISIGIDFGRLLLIICEKQHIAEVISSIWEPEFIDYCEKNNIEIF